MRPWDYETIKHDAHMGVLGLKGLNLLYKMSFARPIMSDFFI